MSIAWWHRSSAPTAPGPGGCGRAAGMTSHTKALRSPQRTWAIVAGCLALGRKDTAAIAGIPG